MLFVIDNSGTMGEEQLNLAQNFPVLIGKLENLEMFTGVPMDVNIAVTTTDFGKGGTDGDLNPWCAQWETLKPEYVAASGAHVNTACTTRLEQFTGVVAMDQTPPTFDEACTEVCTNDAAVPSDSFIHFDGNGDNIPNGTPSEALSCIGPQGIDGCGYESQLEAMLQSLNPGAPWNQDFLRDDAVLAIVMITDEADCSVKDYTMIHDETFMEWDPEAEEYRASSAICWNAGVTCSGPDVDGVYTDCQSTTNDKLQPTARYIDFLQYFVQNQDKEVVMLGILGVPLVTRHSDDLPYEPIEGGVHALVYRDWDAGVYPSGDILPLDNASGEDAMTKTFQFGIGPGCTGQDGMGGFTGQAIPPVRIKEVCESLNRDDDPGTADVDETAVRCCIESICDTDFSAALNCLSGIIQDSLTTDD